jgi:hypothetical protein
VRRGSNGTGPFTVGGDPKERKLPSLGVAISLATTLTCHAEGENQRGVFKDGQRVGRITKHADRSVTVEVLA